MLMEFNELDLDMVELKYMKFKIVLNWFFKNRKFRVGDEDL